jgi:hypothetical protein
VLIEPTPALPPSRRGGRARLVAAVVAPALVLVVVVGAGTLGASPASTDPSERPAALASPAAVAPSVAPTGAVAPDAPAADVLGGFPARVLGLPARTVADLLDLRRAGALGDELQAVLGYVTVRPGTRDCFIGDETGATLPMVQATGCRREVVISDTDQPLLGWTSGEVAWLGQIGQGHVHAPVFPGVSLADLENLVAQRAPTTVDGVAETDGQPAPIAPAPALIIGRFDDPRVADPRSSVRHVNETFMVERVAWAAGTWQEQPAVVLARPTAEMLPIEEVRERVSAALPSGTVVLGHSFLGLDDLAEVDPTASGLARAGLAAEGLEVARFSGVWYVRVMVRDGNPVDTLAGDTVPRRLAWVVLAADGTVLALAVDGFSPDG